MFVPSTNERCMFRLSAFVQLFESYRDIFLTGQTPAAWQLIYPAVIASAVLAVLHS